MKKIDLTEIDQFGYVVNKTSWNTNGITTNQLLIDFGDHTYVFDNDGKLLQTNEIKKD